MSSSSSFEINDSTLTRLVVERGLASAADLEEAREQVSMRRDGGGNDHYTLAHALVDGGVLTAKQGERLLAECAQSKVGGIAGEASQQIPGYQMLSKLGAGAMATVYKAKQVSLDRMVAVKILPQKYSSDAAFVKRFYDEGKAAAQLNHPHIVQAYDVGHAGEYYYFVMEYVDGWTVHDDIEKDGKYKEVRALEVAMDVVKALAHAHEMGFVHRDVKPKNIMITKAGTAKLADMGLARAISDREAAEAEKGKAFGTPYYIAPEQIQGEMHIDHRADIYSFGATLYHMVTGQVPFDGATPTAVMYRHLRDELEPADQVNPKLSQGISEIIEVCMAKKVDARYATTEDLLADLVAVSQGEPPHIARKNFDVASFAKLDDADDSVQSVRHMHAQGPMPATQQPLFWPMVMGWAVAGALLLTLILVLAVK